LQQLLADLKAAKGNGIEEFKRFNPTKDDPYGGLRKELVHLRLLSERRRAAAGFLRKAGDLVPTAAQPRLNGAAKRYDRVARLTLQAFVLRHGSLEEHDRIRELHRQSVVFHGAVTDRAFLSESRREERLRKHFAEWQAYWRRADENLADAEKRKDLAQIIQQAVDNEHAAIAEIEKALTVLR